MSSFNPWLLAALMAFGNCHNEFKVQVDVVVVGKDGPIRHAHVDANSQKRDADKKGHARFILHDSDLWLVVWADDYSPETINEHLKGDTAIFVELSPLHSK